MAATKNAPKYLITQEPGVATADGFKRPGEILEDLVGIVPSTSFRPVNAEAVEPLRQSFADTTKRLSERLAVSRGADRFKVRAELDALAAKEAAALEVLTEADIGNLRSRLVGSR